MSLKEDITEIKDDVKELKDIVQKALIDQAVIETRLNTISGKVNWWIASTLSVLAYVAYASWDFIKAKLM